LVAYPLSFNSKATAFLVKLYTIGLAAAGELDRRTRTISGLILHKRRSRDRAGDKDEESIQLSDRLSDPHQNLAA
jgi:hypothetical protein